MRELKEVKSSSLLRIKKEVENDFFLATFVVSG